MCIPVPRYTGLRRDHLSKMVKLLFGWHQNLTIILIVVGEFSICKRSLWDSPAPEPAKKERERLPPTPFFQGFIARNSIFRSVHLNLSTFVFQPKKTHLLSDELIPNEGVHGSE